MALKVKFQVLLFAEILHRWMIVVKIFILAQLQGLKLSPAACIVEPTSHEKMSRFFTFCQINNKQESILKRQAPSA